MLGELAVVASRPREIFQADAHWVTLLDDIQRRGFYPELPSIELTARNGWLLGDNPYRRIGAGKPDRVVAKVVRSKGRARRLLVVCHCYGIPIPRVMERLFGLRDLDGTDVVYNITNHHVRGSFTAWPGTGFLRARPSHLLENVRSAISGVRALVDSVANRYEKVTVLGYSLGGHLALHLANTAPIHQAILYCPVVDARTVMREIGKGILGVPIETAVKLFQPAIDPTRANFADPLSHAIRIPEEALHVIAQRHDAVTRIDHIRAISRRYPGASFRVYDGTHLYPAGADDFRRVIRALV